MEMKKTLLKTSRKGRMSATIWWLYSDSDKTIPAMKAPRASDSPNCEVSHDVPRLISTTEMMKTSGLRRRTM
jgi:hypothetical protein